MYYSSSLSKSENHLAQKRRRSDNRKVVKLLSKARELFIGPNQDGKGWTQGAFARDKRGDETHSETSSDAVSFCIMGGLNRAREELGYPYNVQSLAETRLSTTMGDDLVETNDDKKTTFPKVLIALDLAIIGGSKIGEAG